MAVVWDPVQYGRFSAHRSRPFAELVDRIGAAEPRRVVDLGCGPGELTATLAARWPGARIEGLDSSPDMIEAARAHADGDRLRFSLGDVADWRPAEPVDVIVSNAVLQWVPGHAGLLGRWVGSLAPGGWLAFQVPGNFEDPSHRLLREVCDSPRWRDRVNEPLRGAPVRDAAGYLDLLAGAGCSVDAWETTYMQVLQGEDPVLEWFKGTALRPILSGLDDAAGAQFLAEYGERLREAFPARPYGTVFPFRRVFVVARRDG